MPTDAGESGAETVPERIAEATSVVSKKWHLATVRALLDGGPQGFNDLQSRLGSVSSKVLSEGLDDLQEEGIVDRRVLSESPLRVEYSLTAKGEALEPAVDAIEAWADEFLAGEATVVLVADDDPRVADMQADWLSDRYEVRTGYDADTTLGRADGADVAVMDRGLGPPDTDTFARVADAVDAGVVALSSARPGPEIVDLPCEEYLVKPTDATQLREAVDTILSRTRYEADVREYLTLLTKRAAIREATSERMRADSEDYSRLQDRIGDLEGRIDDASLADARERVQSHGRIRGQ